MGENIRKLCIQQRSNVQNLKLILGYADILDGIHKFDWPRDTNTFDRQGKPPITYSSRRDNSEKAKSYSEMKGLAPSLALEACMYWHNADSSSGSSRVSVSSPQMTK
ncbi:hypothetical protein AAY473_009896 [Plecturocebus cupreus]